MPIECSRQITVVLRMAIAADLKGANVQTERNIVAMRPDNDNPNYRENQEKGGERCTENDPPNTPLRPADTTLGEDEAAASFCTCLWAIPWRARLCSEAACADTDKEESKGTPSEAQVAI